MDGLDGRQRSSLQIPGSMWGSASFQEPTEFETPHGWRLDVRNPATSQNDGEP